MLYYDSLVSGNAYKVRLLMSYLGVRCKRVDVDILEGAARNAEFLAMNPVGQVPLLEIEAGRWLAESGAILWYLAEGTDYCPSEPFARAQTLRWMFFEQNALEPHLGFARVWLSLLRRPQEVAQRLAVAQGRAREALAVMESHLTGNDFFSGEGLTIADVALYGYTHMADEADIDLDGYPAVQAWLGRVQEHPQHIPITHPYP